MCVCVCVCVLGGGGCRFQKKKNRNYLWDVLFIDPTKVTWPIFAQAQ